MSVNVRSLEEIIKSIKSKKTESLKSIANRRKQYFEDVSGLTEEISGTNHRKAFLERESKNMNSLHQTEIKPLLEKVETVQNNFQKAKVLTSQKEEKRKTKEAEENQEAESATTEFTEGEMLIKANDAAIEVQIFQEHLGFKILEKNNFQQMVFNKINPENPEKCYTITLDASTSRIKLVDIDPIPAVEFEGLQFTLDNDPTHFAVEVRRKFVETCTATCE